MNWSFSYVGPTGNMSTSDVRTPRPAKTPAWSVPPMMTSPMEDPSSCSDNASDNSDKLDSFCQTPAQNTTSKTRKRKMVTSGGGPGYMNPGAMNGAVESGPPGRMPQNPGEHGGVMTKDMNDARNSG